MVKPGSLFMIVFAGIILAIWWTFKDTSLPGQLPGTNEASQQGGY